MYDQQTSAVQAALTNTNSTIFNAETVAAIIDLVTGPNDTVVATEALTTVGGNVTVPAGTELAYITTSAVAVTTLNAPSDVNVVLFQGGGGVNATFGGTATGSAPGEIDRIVVGSAVADKITIADGQNTHITAGAGDTVVTGAGADTVVAGLGNSTVEGGTGFAIVDLTGDVDDYSVVATTDGRAIVTNDNGTKTDITGIQFVQLDDGQALIFANDEVEVAVTALYEATFGRTADAYGLDFWFDRAREGVSLSDIAEAFIQSEEYQEGFGNVSNNQFVQNLYQNTFGRDATIADIAYWGNLLNTGGADRAALVETFAGIATDVITGDSTEVTVIGNITIVNDIV